MSEQSKETSATGATRAGFVAILGPPNAGKSTLMNRILGQKLAIVTAKPQTTRSRILGIHSIPGAQLLFVDTPGLHASTKLLNTVLNEAVEEAMRSCEVGVLLVDRSRGWQDAHGEIYEALRTERKPIVLVETKMDLAGTPAFPWPADLAGLDAVPQLRVSGLTGEGVNEVVEQIASLLPESPPLYGDDELTDRPLRWLAGELVREAAFEGLGQELPYALAVDVIKFDESREDLVTIHANLLVMRNSQKRIVVGKGGEQIKEIGTRARKQIEQLVGSRVHLQLFVKVDPKWLKSARRIDGLGYN